MGRIGVISFSGAATSAPVDFFQMAADQNCMLLVHEFAISQTSEVTDAQEEMLLLRFRPSVVSPGSGGATGTPVPRNGSDGLISTFVTNNTTKATGGAPAELWGWNVRQDFQKIWTPETRPLIGPSQTGVFELVTTPADSVTFAGYIIVEELG